jgi:FdhD protein
MTAENSSSRLPTAVRKVEHIAGHAEARSRQDSIAVEEPLEIRLRIAGEPRPGTALSVTMRTPGDDADLAMGFLFGEGVVRGVADVAQLAHCGPTGQVIAVELAAGVPDPRGRLQRSFYTTSSCGVCGKSSIEAVLATVPARREAGMLVVDRSVLTGLPGKLAAQQMLFACTGGIHAAALFSADGTLLCVREDVGRHNATDKLIGARLRGGFAHFDATMLLLSGRASFELLQKAAVAGIPLVAAIGAPSSLAIELAAEFGITLVGFLRDGNFNVYCGGDRIRDRHQA